MPRVRYSSEGGRYRITGQTFEPGDVHEVSEALAAHLVDDVGEFELVDEADAGETGPAAADVHEEDGPPDGDDDGDDAVDDADGDDDLVATLQDQTIPEIEDDLESGRYDDRLDELAEAEQEGQDRTGVHDAIGVRRAEIEEA